MQRLHPSQIKTLKNLTGIKSFTEWIVKGATDLQPNMSSTNQVIQKIRLQSLLSIHLLSLVSNNLISVPFVMEADCKKPNLLFLILPAMHYLIISRWPQVHQIL